ncbi:MAG: glycosyltransferase family 9 protein [Gammaproteobacteria bacterium]|nr:glycosyltransferase family 9 protein [Gammaproteobacteria bacterium]
MEKPSLNRPARILVIRAGALGDTAYASSIIEPLRHAYGKDTAIDWVAKAGIGKLFAQDPRIRQVFELKSRRAPLPANKGKLRIVAQSWQEPYDLIVNLELDSFFDTTLRLARAAKKIGSPYRHFKEPAETHAVENLHIIYRSFLPADAMRYAYPKLLGTDVAVVKGKFSLNGRYLVVVASNSHFKSAPERNYRAWPISHWKELLNKLCKSELQVVMVGGRNEADYFALLEPLPGNVCNLVGNTNFPELIGLITGAEAVISTDTGPAHIAGAVNTPVYAIIGPTNFKRTGPYPTPENEIHILSANLPCSPCYHTQRFKDCPKNQCMYDVTPDHVIDALRQNKVITI